jgi:hypothetical protein
MFPLESGEPSKEAMSSLAKVWDRIAEWIAHHDQTHMHVQFQHGKITRVDVREAVQKWELVPE